VTCTLILDPLREELWDQVAVFISSLHTLVVVGKLMLFFSVSASLLLYVPDPDRRPWDKDLSSAL